MPKISKKRYLLGTVYRLDKGKLLVRAKSIPNLADKVLNHKLKEIGYVTNIIGPVSSPIVVVKLTKDVELAEGMEIYGQR